MKKLAILTSVFLAVGVLTVLALIASSPKRSVASPPARDRVVIDQRQSEMTDADQRMLERMRVSVSPNMGTMIAGDQMWIDPEMIRLQEENQAALDRMVGRRPGSP